MKREEDQYKESFERRDQTDNIESQMNNNQMTQGDVDNKTIDNENKVEKFQELGDNFVKENINLKEGQVDSNIRVGPER